MTAASSSPDMDVILAAGGVLCRLTPAGDDEVLVVHRKRYGDWTLPKGKLKPGESFVAAALREVAEETGCMARIEDYLGAIGYVVNGIPKAVLFWRMSPIEQTEIADHEEVAEVLWMPVAAAIQRLTYTDERAFALRAGESVRDV
jgi:8-oxo-dGTP pyrophosphatase MutT (NUDIX family)